MTPNFIAGTRPGSLTNESGLFTTDLSVKPARTHDDVIGVAAGGDSPEWLFRESRTLVTTITMTGMPIPTSGGAYQGLCALEDADEVTTLANLIEGQVFGIDITQGMLVSEDPEYKRARSGTGQEFTFNLKHGWALN